MRAVRVLAVLAALVALAGCDRSLRLGPRGETVQPPTPGTVQMASASLATRFGGPATTVELWVRIDEPAAPEAPCEADGSPLIRGYDETGAGIFWPASINRWSLVVAADGDPWVGVDRTLAIGGSLGTPLCADLPGAGLRDGEWHHVAFQRQATGAMALLVDGQQVAAGTGPAGSLAGDDPLQAPDSYYPRVGQVRIGGQPVVDGTLANGGEPPAMLVDEVRLSTTLRYGSSQVPPAGRFTPDAATHALWRFDGTVVRPPLGQYVLDQAQRPEGPSDLRLGLTSGGVLLDEDSPFD